MTTENMVHPHNEALFSNEFLTNAATQMKPGTRLHTAHDSIYMRGHNWQSSADRKSPGGCQGLGGLEGVR